MSWRISCFSFSLTEYAACFFPHTQNSVISHLIPQLFLTIKSLAPDKEIKLNLGDNIHITDQILEKTNAFSNLTSLSLSAQNTITDLALANLTKLTSLTLSSNDTITDVGLGFLTNLTFLGLIDNNMITDAGLAQLPKLNFLILIENKTITDGFLKNNPQIHVQRYNPS